MTTPLLPYFLYGRMPFAPTPPLPYSPTPLLPHSPTPLLPYSPTPPLPYSCTGECHSPLLPARTQIYRNCNDKFCIFFLLRMTF
ncbi:MAG: hypothetical protein SWX82_16750 [Cyanobacteriota bacterium]|nr:hypothetical protein [Cyanobacteriota bacterium]